MFRGGSGSICIVGIGGWRRRYKRGMDGCCRLCQHCRVGHRAYSARGRPGSRSDRTSYRRNEESLRSARDVIVENRVRDIALYRWLLAELHPYWRGHAGIVFLSFSSSPLCLLTPLSSKLAYSTVVLLKTYTRILYPLTLDPACHTTTSIAAGRHYATAF